MKSTVSVLLSSYNGERFISEQIDSIMNQKNVITLLTVRDDGSLDNTCNVVRKFQQKYPNRIKLVEEKNVGYRRSFLHLLELALPADYYGFSDQDDYWLPEKCISAIRKIKQISNPVALYASGVILTDEDLNIIGKTDSATMPLTLESYFTRQRLAGCTYLFTEKLRELSCKFDKMDYPDKKMPDHDFVVGSCAFACGEVFLDHKQYILHRRHKSSITSGGMGIIRRFKVEYEITFKRVNVQSTMAKELLNKCGKQINQDDMIFLKMVAEYKSNSRYRRMLLNSNKLTTEMKICDMETRLKIRLGNY